MAELSRRLFLIGTAAAIAAAKVTTPFAEAVPAQAAYRLRRLYALSVGFGPSDKDEFAQVDLRRGDNTILQLCLSTRSTLYWSAGYDPLRAIIFMPEHTLDLSLNSPVGVARVDLTCEDYYDGGQEPVWLSESHEFPRKGPATVRPFDPKDETFLKRVLGRPV